MSNVVASLCSPCKLIVCCCYEIKDAYVGKRYPEALERFTAFSDDAGFHRISPKIRCDTLKTLGLLLTKQHRLTEALFQFPQAVKVCDDSELPVILHNYAATILQHSYSTRRDMDEARSEAYPMLARCLEIDPTHTRCADLKASSLVTQADVEKKIDIELSGRAAPHRLSADELSEL